MFWVISIIMGLIALQFIGIPLLLYLWVAIGLPIRFFIWVNRKVKYRRLYGKGKWLSDKDIDTIEWVEAELICRELNKHNVYYAKQLMGGWGLRGTKTFHWFKEGDDKL